MPFDLRAIGMTGSVRTTSFQGQTWFCEEDVIKVFPIGEADLRAVRAVPFGRRSLRAFPFSAMLTPVDRLNMRFQFIQAVMDPNARVKALLNEALNLLNAPRVPRRRQRNPAPRRQPAEAVESHI